MIFCVIVVMPLSVCPFVRLASVLSPPVVKVFM